MASNIMKNINDASFVNILEDAEKPVVVLFTTDYSGLSQIMFPRVEENAREFADQVSGVYRCRCEESKNFIARFGIRRVPTLAVFKEGKLVNSRVNVLTSDEIKSVIGQHLDS